MTRTELAQRASRTTRAPIRRAPGRTAGVRENVAPTSRRPTRLATRLARSPEQAARTLGQAPRTLGGGLYEPRTARSVRVRTIRRPVIRLVTRRSTAPRGQRVLRLGNMTAVVAFARSQVGKRYVSGGEGPGGFDCSGFTRSAYARAGIRLPHSSGAQAARARRIARSQARPGDLVVGPGHVGIYMGHGMMIDAGNHRTGVVYRRLYSGLRVERL